MIKNKKKIAAIIGSAVIIIGGASVLGATGVVQNHLMSKQITLGEKYLLALDYEQAIITFNKAIEIDSTCVEAYLGLAQVYKAQGEFEKAISILEEAQKIVLDERITTLLDEVRLQYRIQNPVSAHLDVQSYLTHNGEIIKLMEEADINKDGTLDYIIQTAWNYENTSELEDIYSSTLLIINGASSTVIYEEENYHEMGTDRLVVKEIDNIAHIQYALNHYRFEESILLACEDNTITRSEIELPTMYLGKNNTIIFEFEDSKLNGKIQLSEQHFNSIKKDYMIYDNIGDFDNIYELSEQGLNGNLQIIFSGVAQAFRYSIHVEYKYENHKWKAVSAEYPEDPDFKVIDQSFTIQEEDKLQTVALTEKNIDKLFSLTLEEAEAYLGASNEVPEQMFPCYTFENCNFEVVYGDRQNNYPTAIVSERGFGLRHNMSVERVNETLNINGVIEKSEVDGSNIMFTQIQGHEVYLYFNDYGSLVSIIVKAK